MHIEWKSTVKHHHGSPRECLVPVEAVVEAHVPRRPGECLAPIEAVGGGHVLLRPSGGRLAPDLPVGRGSSSHWISASTSRSQSRRPSSFFLLVDLAHSHTLCSRNFKIVKLRPTD